MFINFLDKKVEYIKIPTTRWSRLWKRLTFQPYQVVYLHGLCAPFQNHIYLLNKISAKGYDVYALNLPGHVQSERWEHITWENLINLTSHFMYEMRIHNPIMLGFSLGAGVVLQMASIPNTDIHSLKLIAPFCYSINAFSPRWIDNFLHATMDKVHAIRTSGKHLVENKVSFSYIIPAYKHLFTEYNLRPEQISIPTSVILLEKDHVLDNQQITSTLCRIEGCQFGVIEDQSHDIYYIPDQKIDEIVAKLF